MHPFSHAPLVSFYFQVKRFTVPKVPLLKNFISNIFSAEKISIESLSYIFCSDDYLITLNRQFLHHDDYTDVVTFNLANNNLPIIGECYISIDRVKENARLYTTTFQNELHRVIFHGALHLCGYADKTDQDILTMRSKEDYYLHLYLTS